MLQQVALKDPGSIVKSMLSLECIAEEIDERVVRRLPGKHGDISLRPTSNWPERPGTASFFATVVVARFSASSSDMPGATHFEIVVGRSNVIEFSWASLTAGLARHARSIPRPRLTIPHQYPDRQMPRLGRN